MGRLQGVRWDRQVVVAGVRDGAVQVVPRHGQGVAAVTHLEQSKRTAGRIKALHDQGLSMVKIAAELGVSYRQVRKTLSPDLVAREDREQNARRSAYKRAWENENDRPPCSRCGGPMGIGAGRRGTSVCRRCFAAEHPGPLEMLRLRVEEGLSNRQIAERLDVSLGWVESGLSRLRAAGYVVPRDPYMEKRREVLNSAA